MKIAIIGSRGIPARYGGFETLAEKLSAYLVKQGHSVTVIGEQASFDKGHLRSVKTLFSKRRFPVLFYLESLMRARRGYDAILLLGVGAGPFLKVLLRRRTRIVTNVDGMEHLRSKFSPLKKWYVRFSQRSTVHHSSLLVVDSAALLPHWMDVLGVKPEVLHVIRYGTETSPHMNQSVLQSFGVRSRDYYLVVARIVPENNIEMIIDGYLASASKRALLIIGNWKDSAYGSHLKGRAGGKITLLDPVYDSEYVQSLRAGCFAYLHGHSVGGTNPTLVEALGSGCITICHDNPFNRETTDGSSIYFSDVAMLAQAIRCLEDESMLSLESRRKESLDLAIKRYDWNEIGAAYEKLLQR